jgi:glucose-fructose oxidoreductase
MNHDQTPISRRQILKSTSALSAILATHAGTAHLMANQPGTGKLGVVLCGLGGFSEKSIAPELASAKNVYLAGVITGDPKGKGVAWAEKYGFPKESIYSYDQMPLLAKNSGIQIVHIATPNGLHAKHALAAIEAGKHVMCEKPMATTSEECRTMIAAAKKAGVQVGVNYRLHFEPHHVELMRLCREKVYGPIKCITAEFSWNRRDFKPWLLDKELSGGGAAFDTGVYPIQAGCYLTGSSPTHVSAIASSMRDVYKPGTEETMSFTLEFPGGVVMQGRASYAHGMQRCDVAADTGFFSCTGGPDGGSAFGQSADGKFNSKQLLLPQKKTFKVDDTLHQQVLLDRFAESIAEKKPFLCDGEMGLRDIIILEAIYRSAAHNGIRTSISI